jgi:hypothetical protein
MVIESERAKPGRRSPLGITFDKNKMEKKNYEITEHNEDDPYDSYRSNYRDYKDDT